MLEANENKEYLPIDGLPAFKKATVQLLLGSCCLQSQMSPSAAPEIYCLRP